MKIVKGLTFKIFISIFISFLFINSFNIKKVYETRVQDMSNTFSSETPHDFTEQDLKKLVVKQREQVEGYKSIHDEKFEYDFRNLCSHGSQRYVAIMNANYQMVELKDLFHEEDYLIVGIIFTNDNESEFNRYHIDISKLTEKQKEELVKQIQKDPKIMIEFSGEIVPRITKYIDQYGDTQEDKNFDAWVNTTYLKVGDSVYMNGQHQKYYEAYFNTLITSKTIVSTFFGDPQSHQNVNTILKKAQDDKKIIQDIVNHHFENATNIYVLPEETEKNYSISKLMDKDVSFEMATGTFEKNNNVVMMKFYPLTADEKGQKYYMIFCEVATNLKKVVLYEHLIDNKYFYMMFVGLMALLAFYISYMITKRIKKIDKVACLITEQDFNHILDEKGHDELSSLSQHINTMSQTIYNNMNQLNEEIDRVKKLEKLRKEFIAKFTHEIKTPLAIINGNIELIQETKDEFKQEEYIEAINKQIAWINSLILQMLDLSKLESNAIELNKQQFNLEDLTVDIIDRHEKLLSDKQIKVELTSKEEPIIYADKNRMMMVIQNFLNNAIKHSEMNSIIYIDITENQFSIENKGNPIPDNIIETIWLSFVSTDQKGTGLGLALCKSILELHELKYGVENTKDGVKFYFQY